MGRPIRGGTRLVKPRLYDVGNDISFWLLGTRSWKVFPGPFHPYVHSLILGQRLVRALHHGCDVAMVAKNYHCARLRIAPSLHPDHNTLLHPWLEPQPGLQIIRVDVRSAGSDYDFFLAPFEIQVPVGIKRSDVSCAVPALGIRHRVRPASIPVTRSHSPAAH